METIKSLMRPSSLCTKNRKYGVKTVLSDYAKHSAKLDCRISDLLINRLAGNINDTEMATEIEHIYDDNEDLNGYARKLRSEDLYKCMKRFVDCETRIPMEAPTAILDIYGLEVNVDPHFMFVNNITKSIEVVRVFFKKPEISATAAAKSVALYSLLYYGKLAGENMFPGEDVKVTASFYYLRKQNDKKSELHPEKDNFDTDFFNVDGKNVVSIKDNNRGNLPDNQRMTNFDTAMYQEVQNFIAGDDNKCYSATDCQYCSMKGVCSYNKSKAPIPSVSRGGLVTRYTDEQQKILECGKGNYSIVAGAGSGKTSVIAGKVLKALKEGIKPKQIVVITFTDAAAQEMKERITKLIANEGIEVDVEEMIIHTFNALGDIFLQSKFQYLGFTERPELIEPSSTKRFVEKILLDNHIEGINYSYLRDEENSFATSGTAVACEVFNTLKALDIDESKPGHGVKENFEEIVKNLKTIEDYISEQMIYDLAAQFDTYQMMMREENLYDYTDQENVFRKLDEIDPDFFRHTGIKMLIVDEDQDSNDNQLDIIRILKKSNCFETLLIVGDPDQSIYGFRGARPEKVMHIEDVLGEKVNMLFTTKNFRSTPEILDVANKFIATNKIREKKDLHSMKDSGKEVIAQALKSGNEEVEFVCDDIADKLKNGVKPEDIAIITRNGINELKKYAEVLNNYGIESNMLIPEHYRSNSRITALIALYTFLTKEEDEADIATYINCCTENQWIKLTDVQRMKTLNDYKSYAMSFSEFSGEEKLAAFFEMAKRIPGAEEDEVYAKYISKLDSIKTWGQLSRMIYDFAVYGGDDTFSKTMKYSGVTLTTAHSSKGLEWKHVYVSTSKFDKPEYHDENPTKELEEIIEEERRLIYVAMTRARDELMVTGKYYCFGNLSQFKGTKFTPSGQNANLFLQELYDIVGKGDLVTEYKSITAASSRKAS